MTEQEYCDLTDLQLLRLMSVVAHKQLNCFNEPLKSKRAELVGIIADMKNYLEPIVSIT